MEMEQIVQGIKDEQDWAYRAVLDQYGDRIFRVAYGILKDRQLAEDTVQEVFFKVFQKISQYTPERSFYAWIYTITVNQCRNRMRRWSFKNLFFIDQYFNQQDEDPTNIEESVLEEEQSQALLQQIQSLKRIYREVLMLYYYEDLSIREISQILGLKENTVKTRLSRGRDQLKVQLERREEFQSVLAQI